MSGRTASGHFYLPRAEDHGLALRLQWRHGTDRTRVLHVDSIREQGNMANSSAILATAERCREALLSSSLFSRDFVPLVPKSWMRRGNDLRRRVFREFDLPRGTSSLRNGAAQSVGRGVEPRVRVGLLGGGRRAKE
jgi:hypothetical protein